MLVLQQFRRCVSYSGVTGPHSSWTVVVAVLFFSTKTADGDCGGLLAGLDGSFGVIRVEGGSAFLENIAGKPAVVCLLKVVPNWQR